MFARFLPFLSIDENLVQMLRKSILTFSVNFMDMSSYLVHNKGSLNKSLLVILLHVRIFTLYEFLVSLISAIFLYVCYFSLSVMGKMKIFSILSNHSFIIIRKLFTCKIVILLYCE